MGSFLDDKRFLARILRGAGPKALDVPLYMPPLDYRTLRSSRPYYKDYVEAITPSLFARRLGLSPSETATEGLRLVLSGVCSTLIPV